MAALQQSLHALEDTLAASRAERASVHFKPIHIPYPTLPYPTLPYPIQPYPTLSYPTLRYRAPPPYALD